MAMNNESSYDLSLYNKEKVLFAVAAYSDFCSVNVLEHDHKIVCVFQSDKIPVARIINEFDNYIIELMQSNVSVPQ